MCQYNAPAHGRINALMSMNLQLKSDAFICPVELFVIFEFNYTGEI